MRYDVLMGAKKKKRILLVDDDSSVLLTLEAAFLTAGYKVVTTTEPRQALRLTEEHWPDAMVVDVMMPEMTGWDVLAAVREREPLDLIPVILLSSLEEASHRIRGLRAGADDFVVKPFEPEEVIARVERQLRRPSRTGAGLWGMLDFQPVQELVQSLENNSKSGELFVQADGLSGYVLLREGRVLKAEWAELHDVQAVHAILELRHGHFRFTPRVVEASEGSHGEPFSFFPLLMQEVWLIDELQARATQLPAADAPLVVSSQAVTSLPQALVRLPAAQVCDHLRQHPGATLDDLLAQSFDSPRTLRLAVAWLRELGHVAVDESASKKRPEEPLGELPTLVDGAFRTFFLNSAARSFAHDTLEVRFLVHELAWESLAPLLHDVSDIALPAVERQRKARIFTEKGGELTLCHESGRAKLRFFDLAKGQGGLDRVSDVVLWLGEGVDGEQLAASTAVLDGVLPPGAARLAACSGPKVRHAMQRCLGGTSSPWMFLDYLPQTLQDLLLVLTFASS
jgi:DNA-binding response OmpR family regulator